MQPVSFGYTGGVPTEQSADGPLRARGQSASVEKESTRGGFSSGLMLKLDCGQSAHGPRMVRSCCFQVDPGSLTNHELQRYISS